MKKQKSIPTNLVPLTKATWEEFETHELGEKLSEKAYWELSQKSYINLVGAITAEGRVERLRHRKESA